jgi:CubicO group peptidase (beta-lactamase class C family)
MSDAPRPLPSRPSLRYLKLTAKRRLAAGEFTTLNDAQVAIAREHGLPSWTALKRLVTNRRQSGCHALAQLQWVISRFREAGQPGWAAPAEPELRQHFDDHFLTTIAAGELIAAIADVAATLREDLVVIGQTPLEVRASIAGLEIFASVEADPPHRLTDLQGYPLGGSITDTRVAAPPPGRTAGAAPAEMARIADATFTELGLVGLVLAGGGPGTPAWVIAKGWADLDRAEVLDTGHRFAAPGVAALVTATAVLRLVADGRFDLDTPVNDRLRTTRLADDTVTVRELLSHTGGVDIAAELFAGSVPDLATLAGPVIACDGARGLVRPSNGGYAVLGQLIADVTGSPFADAAARLVLDPLGMNASSFPARPAHIGPHAVTGYNVTPTGTFVPVAARVCTMPAAGGLWASAADLVRLGTGWSSLLPATLTREALTPRAEAEPGAARAGLGWLISQGGDTALHGGASPGFTASLSISLRDNQVRVTLANRNVPIGDINPQAPAGAVDDGAQS